MKSISISFRSPPLTLASVLERHSVALVERYTEGEEEYLRLVWHKRTVALYKVGDGFYREVSKNGNI